MASRGKEHVTSRLLQPRLSKKLPQKRSLVKNHLQGRAGQPEAARQSAQVLLAHHITCCCSRSC